MVIMNSIGEKITNGGLDTRPSSYQTVDLLQSVMWNFWDISYIYRTTACRKILWGAAPDQPNIPQPFFNIPILPSSLLN